MTVNKTLNQLKETTEKFKKWENRNHKAVDAFLSAFYILILALYPLRHIHWGLDLWDTGYSYANFKYMGLDSMDPMWLFSTYLANAVGHLLMKLPMAETLAGMNFYTGLFVSVLSLLGYFFCTKKLGIPKFLAFVGEFAALSLCWCPTAILYNYLTYLLFLVCVILLFTGLTKDKKFFLFAAGVCLGTNVLVRFSNLPQMALIVAVWAYGVIEALEAGKVNKAKCGPKKKFSESACGKTIVRTLWCLGGYLAALAVLFGYISARYGMDTYVEGIQRLFAMTDNATDYKASSMIMKIISDYQINFYWVKKILAVAVLGVMFFGVVRFLSECKSVFRHREDKIVQLNIAARFVWVLACIWMVVWLNKGNFYSFDGYQHGASAIWHIGIVFLTLTLAIALIRIFHPRSPKEEKLISGMIFLVILLTSIGSNNGNYPSINNLFIAAPYTFWEAWRFCRKIYSNEVIKAIVFPIKAVLVAFLVLFTVHSGVFGARFLFEDTKGAQNLTATVDNNEVLKGIKMSPERATWLSSISEYVEEEKLQGREVILYGNIPSLSYYLQMPSAFNPWIDLRSYSVETLEAALAEQQQEIKRKENPVIIIAEPYSLYMSGGRNVLEKAGVAEETIEKIEQDAKLELLIKFKDRNKYKNAYSNGKFTVWK